MSSDNSNRIVFVGNIPYGLSEEQINEILSSVGPVRSLRMVFDSDTGRAKGYGFAEFADTDAAASAVRNLNNYEIMGRELRVDFSHVGGKEDAVPAGYNFQMPQPPQPPSGHNQQPASSGLPPLPPGAEVPPGLTCTSAISKTLSTLPTQQLLDILSQMKGLVMGDPAKATELLKQAPQLSYAIFQALLLMGLVDTAVLSSVVEQASQPAAPPPQHLPPSRPAPAFQPPPQPPYQYPSMPTQIHAPTPPVLQQPYQPPPIQAPPPPPPPQQQPGHEELLKQVLAMTQEQINQLAPMERAQIMALRQSLAGRY
ncbi:hypothetical protein MMC07_004746 [Pseudocyphellaria aurata]|nr:hypothetical protein [Pseudocyphellaria aurata]